MKTKFLSLILATSLVGVIGFNGCGGGGTDNASSPPVFTTSNTVGAITGSTTVATIRANDADGDAITFNITGGNDASLFQIDQNTGLLQFLDSAIEDTYQVEITISAGGDLVTQSFVVTVNDNSINNSQRFVFQTEQVNSRDSGGVLVAKEDLFNDAFYESGTNRSYTKSLGIVKDNITGLEWQDNAQPLKDLHGNAEVVCAELTLNGKGWRLPEVEELNSITVRGREAAGTISTVFENLKGDNLYWTNTHAAPFNPASPTFWGIDFFSGTVLSMAFNSERYIRCVRGNPLPVSGDFERISADEVLDKSTNLIWQDDIDVLRSFSWEDALTQCRNKGKFVQWRTPTIEELYSLIDRLSEEGISSEFNFVVPDPTFRYWSSTTTYDGVIYTGFEAWSLDFVTQNMFADSKTTVNNTVTCVRDAN